MATNNLDELFTEIEKISEIEKCQTCQCFYDTLLEFKELLNEGKNNEEMKQSLSTLIQNAEITHNCLGCDPCLPVPVSNALSEIAGMPSLKTCRPVCKPLMSIKKPSQLYPEQGEFIIGREKCSVAISTLSSDALREKIAGHLGSDNFAIIGETHTENIGIEKVVKNTVSNPSIRFIILCGKDSKGHLAGQSMVSLFNNGVGYDKRIIGSTGQRPILKNLELEVIEHFRSQVEFIDLTGSEDIAEIEKKVHFCLEQKVGRFDKTLSLKKKPLIEAQMPQRLILDPSGFFIIYPNKEEGKIYLEHYLKDGTLNETIYGEDPVLIASTAIELGLVSRLDHAAYLGRELEKAYLSICFDFQYVQDGAPTPHKEGA
jgi:tetrahydromethanopterin S-methyltransferase subunit A